MHHSSWSDRSIGFVCEYQKKSVWFSTYNLRYAVITNDTLRIFKNERDFQSFVKEEESNSKNRKANSSYNPKESIYLRRIHLSQIKNEARHPHLLMIKDRGNIHLLSFTKKEEMSQCIMAINSAQRSSIVRSNSISNHGLGIGISSDDTNIVMLKSSSNDTLSNDRLSNLPNYDSSVMNENELNQYYNELLMSFNISQIKRKEMIKEKTADYKWKFVISNLLKQQGLQPELWTPTTPDDIYTVISNYSPAVAPGGVGNISGNTNQGGIGTRQNRTQTQGLVVSPRIIERHNINRDVSFWVRVLRVPENIQLEQLTDVSERLYEENVDWLTGFVNEQGLTLLVQFIPYTMNISDLGMQFALQTELLRCLKAIMDKQAGNMKLGLQYIVQDHNAIQGITDLFDNQSLQV